MAGKERASMSAPHDHAPELLTTLHDHDPGVINVVHRTTDTDENLVPRPDDRLQRARSPLQATYPDADMVVLVEVKRGSVRAADGTTVRPRELLLAPWRVGDRVHAETGTTYWAIWFAHTHFWMTCNHTDAATRLPAPPGSLRIWRQLQRERTLPDTYAPRYTAALLQLLLIKALRTVAPADGLAPDLLARLEQAVCNHPDHKHTAEQWATTFAMSVHRFRRLVHSSFKMPYRSWLLHQRMRVAADLLRHSQASIGEIGARVGCSTPAIFARQFRKIYDQSPRDWRRCH